MTDCTRNSLPQEPRRTLLHNRPTCRKVHSAEIGLNIHVETVKQSVHVYEPGIHLLGKIKNASVHLYVGFHV